VKEASVCVTGCPRFTDILTNTALTGATCDVGGGQELVADQPAPERRGPT
jgi:hypothetical protein